MHSPQALYDAAILNSKRPSNDQIRLEITPESEDGKLGLRHTRICENWKDAYDFLWSVVWKVTGLENASGAEQYDCPTTFYLGLYTTDFWHTSWHGGTPTYAIPILQIHFQSPTRMYDWCRLVGHLYD